MIYLDNNATMPLVDGAKEAIKMTMENIIGNPSSHHWAGRKSALLIEETRQNISRLVSGSDYKIIFTSSATEANNMALNGYASIMPKFSNILISPMEHSSCYKPTTKLKNDNDWNLKEIPVNSNGEIEVEEYRKLCNDGVNLAIIQWVNHEIGTIQDIVRYSIIANRRNGFFHCDGVQALGKIDVNLSKTQITTFSISAHKIGGPQGIGALLIHKDLKIPPLILGGSQEGNMRAGTEATLLIAGFNGALLELINNREKWRKIGEKIKYL